MQRVQFVIFPTREAAIEAGWPDAEFGIWQQTPGGDPAFVEGWLALDHDADPAHLPHVCRRLVTEAGMTFHATSDRDLEAAMAATGGSRVVQYYLVHRTPDGADGHEEVIREFRV